MFAFYLELLVSFAFSPRSFFHSRFFPRVFDGLESSSPHSRSPFAPSCCVSAPPVCLFLRLLLRRVGVGFSPLWYADVIGSDSVVGRFDVSPADAVLEYAIEGDSPLLYTCTPRPSELACLSAPPPLAFYSPSSCHSAHLPSPGFLLDDVREFPIQSSAMQSLSYSSGDTVMSFLRPLDPGDSAKMVCVCVRAYCCCLRELGCCVPGVSRPCIPFEALGSFCASSCVPSIA